MQREKKIKSHSRPTVTTISQRKQTQYMHAKKKKGSSSDPLTHTLCLYIYICIWGYSAGKPRKCIPGVSEPRGLLKHNDNDDVPFVNSNTETPTINRLRRKIGNYSSSSYSLCITRNVVFLISTTKIFFSPSQDYRTDYFFFSSFFIWRILRLDSFFFSYRIIDVQE